MRLLPLLLLLLSAGVFAQAHEHDAPRARASIKVPKSADPDARAHWPGAAITPRAGESIDHASQHALPIGSGAAADGQAWLRPDVTGIYTVYNFRIRDLEAVGNPKPPFAVRLYAGRIYRIVPVGKAKAAWTLPDSKRKVAVPAANLIAPMVVGKPAGKPYP